MNGISKATELMAKIAALSTGVSILIAVMALFSSALTGLLILSKGQVYEKAGYASWKSIVPIYNLYILYKIAWGSGWLFLLNLIPIVNLVMGILTKYKLVKVFDAPFALFIVLIFMPVVGFPVMGYSNELEYIGDARGNDIFYTPVVPTSQGI